MAALHCFWPADKARGGNMSFMDLGATSNAVAGPKAVQPFGRVRFGTVWRRCSLVAERCGYAPRSRLAIRPQTALARTVPIYETASRGRRVCAASVYGFSAGEMRKIAHNLHAKEKEEIASGRARKFRGSI